MTAAFYEALDWARKEQATPYERDLMSNLRYWLALDRPDVIRDGEYLAGRVVKPTSF